MKRYALAVCVVDGMVPCIHVTLKLHLNFVDLCREDGVAYDEDREIQLM